MSDHELLDELQSRLLLTVQRSMALAPGRGMLHLNTVAPIATQTIRITPLCLSGKSRQASAGLINLKDPAAVNLTWPNFHNGVAAALQVERPSQHSDPLKWVAFSKFACRSRAI